MNQRNRLTPLTLSIALAAAALFASGCSSSKNNYSEYKKHSGLYTAGILNVEKNAYTDTDPTSFVLESDDIANRENISGDRVTALWGLFSYIDYSK